MASCSSGIDTDYATNTFVHDIAATLDLASSYDPRSPACQSAALATTLRSADHLVDPALLLRHAAREQRAAHAWTAAPRPCRSSASTDASVVHGNESLRYEVPEVHSFGGRTAATCARRTCPRFPKQMATAVRTRRTRRDAPARVQRSVQDLQRPRRSTDQRRKPLSVADRRRDFISAVETTLDTMVDAVSPTRASPDPTPISWPSSPTAAALSCRCADRSR